MFLLACARTQPQVIVITATPQPVTGVATVSSTQPPDSAVAEVAAANPVASGSTVNTQQQRYVVRAGDTLSSIAAANNVLVDVLADMNNIENPNLLSVGQVLQIPAAPTETTPNIRLIPNNRLVRSASASGFGVAAFVAQQPGYIQTASGLVTQTLADGTREEIELSAAAIVERVSEEFSVDPRLLLALLEHQTGWLTTQDLSENDILYPMGRIDENREGLYRQLTWAADRLNTGYYGWRYRDLQVLQFAEGERLLYHPDLNAGTVGVQYFLSRDSTYASWQTQIQVDGFFAVYTALFGDPFAADTSNLIPETLTQPEMTLPFAPGEVWFYTGGPHGGWGQGSAWSAVDFAPPDERVAGQPACYTSEYPVRAIAPGTIVRSEDGAVVLDLDGDGNETTGWTVLYLHIASAGRVPLGARVETGDVIGYASCEGGFSTATHLHIARRYNGEWIPAYCHYCDDGRSVAPAFTMSDWTVVGFENQEYQGIIVRDGEQRQAEQGRQNPINRVTW